MGPTMNTVLSQSRAANGASVEYTPATVVMPGRRVELFYDGFELNWKACICRITGLQQSWFQLTDALKTGKPTCLLMKVDGVPEIVVGRVQSVEAEDGSGVSFNVTVYDADRGLVTGYLRVLA